MAKKLLSLVITVFMLLSTLLTLAACTNSETTTQAPAATTTPSGATPTTTTPISTPTNPSTSDTSSSTVEVRYPSQIESMKSTISEEAPTIVFLYVEGANGTYTADSIWVDPDSILDDVDETIIERNERIHEDLGVTIEPFDAMVGISGLQEFAKAEFDAPTGAFDVYCGYQYYDISLATQKHLVNLNTLVNDKGEKIIDISQPYWATNYINSITYNNYLYWVTGDLAFRYTGGLYCTFVNTEIYDTYVKQAYDNRTIYQVVDAGEWDIDTMLNMASLGWGDADNSGVANEGDRIGIVLEENDVMDGIAFGCKIAFGKKITDPATGKDEISINLNVDANAKTLAQKLYTMFTAPYVYDAPALNSQNMMPLFANGEALFAVNKIYLATVFLSEMETYAIIPTPKLDSKSQDKYYSGVHDSITIFGISRYSEHIEAAAATLELMSYYSNQLVTPVYYEKVMKGGRTVRDDEAPGMIDLIREGFDSDFVAAWSASIENIVHIYRTPSNLRNFSNFLKVKSSNWPIKLARLLEQLDEAANEDLV